MKNDPRPVAAARELKDRCLKRVNGGLYLPEARGNYVVSRAIGEREGIDAGGVGGWVSEPAKRLAA